jgi:hypothetical protein
VAAKAGWGTGQRSAVVAPRLVASGAPGEAESQTPSRDLGGVAMCVTRAHAAPRAGVEGRERQVAGASSVLVEAPMAVGAEASSVAGVVEVVGASSVAVGAGAPMAGAADVGEAGVIGRIRVRGSFSLCLQQDGCCTSDASTIGDERHTGSVSDSSYRSP